MHFPKKTTLRLFKLLFLVAGLFCGTRAFSQTDTTETYSKWGFGMELGPASGLFGLTGEAKDHFSDGWAYNNVGITISYSKIHFTGRAGGIDGLVTKNLANDSLWKTDNAYGTSNIQFAVGYEVLNTRYFSIIPYASAGMTGFHTGPDIKGANSIDFEDSFSYSFGSTFDFKFNWQCLYLRMLTGVYPGYFQRSFGLDGSMFYANLSLGFYVTGRNSF